MWFTKKKVIHFPKKHIKDLLTIYDKYRNSPSKTNKYILWKFIENIIPEVGNGKEWTLNTDHILKIKLICKH